MDLVNLLKFISVIRNPAKNSQTLNGIRKKEVFGEIPMIPTQKINEARNTNFIVYLQFF
jgi:hypothetical protein